jgi:squalene synthase HpnD
MNKGPAVAEELNTGAARRASGSSFYMAMRILPRAQREAMFQIYGFCRSVDDIADSAAPHAERLRQLALWRSDIDALYAARPPAHLAELARCATAFSLARADFEAVIEGMEMDAAQDIRAPTFDTLDLYCDRVASAVGRLSVRVFGIRRPEGVTLAHHLGRALQLTNILRDLDEDAAIGRLYLPRESLRAAGIDGDDPATVLAHAALAPACLPVVERARMHFAEAEQIMARCPRAAVRAPRIMAEVYRAMLEQMVSRGWSPPRERVRIGRLQLLWIVLRHALL